MQSPERAPASSSPIHLPFYISYSSREHFTFAIKKDIRIQIFEKFEVNMDAAFFFFFLERLSY
jgi:hypothetical protein